MIFTCILMEKFTPNKKNQSCPIAKNTVRKKWPIPKISTPAKI